MAKRQYTVTVTQEQLRRFSQYEILFEQLIGTKVLDFEEDVLLRGNAYPMTMEDVAQMVENVRRKKDFVGSFLIGWLYPLHYDNGTGLQSLLGLLPSGKKAEDCTEYVLPVTERSYVRSVLRELVMDLFDFEEDYCSEMWKIKKQFFENADVDIIVSSQFMLNMIKENPYTKKLNVHVLPFGIDPKKYSFELSKSDAKKKLGINPNSIVLFFREAKEKGTDY